MPLLTTLLLWLSVILTISFIIFVLFFERREPSRRMGWLLALIFLPFIGMIFYLLFSGHFFTKNRRMQKAKEHINGILAEHLQKQLELISDKNSSVNNPLLEQYKTLIEMNISYGKSLLSFDEELDIFLWGKDKFEALCADLEQAKSSINMTYFIFHNDVIGTRIMDILCKKAKEGVTVKLMYDDFGCFFTPALFFNRLNKAGGQAKPFFPIRNGFLFSLNFRNHRKIVVIDGTIGYTGGFNVGDEYVNQSRRKKVLWRDTHVRFKGMSVLMLQLVFLIDWHSVSYADRTIESPEEASKYFPLGDFKNISQMIIDKSRGILTNDGSLKKLIPVQIVSSGPNDFQKDEIKDAIIRMIMNAKHSVYIQTPYFTPDETFFNVLKITAYSGIDVRIMVPDQWDKFYVRAAAFDYIREMIDFGIKFYHYPGFIHAKTTVVDGEVVTIGTTNIDLRSFSLHFEVNAFVYDKEFAQKNQQIFLDDQAKCRLSEKSWYDKRFILQRAWWGFCRLFSPLM